MGACHNDANRTAAKTMDGTELTNMPRMTISDVLRVFTEGEKHAIAFALRIAGDQYEKNRLAMLEPPMHQGYALLAVEFEKQKTEILTLADALDNGISLALCTCPTCDAGLDDEQALHSVSCSLSRSES